MKKHLISLFACVLLAAGSGAGHAAAEMCEPLRERIEANIASKGISHFSVTVVDANATVTGAVVGTCGNGAQKIVYSKGAGSQAVQVPGGAPAPTSAPISAHSAAPTAAPKVAPPKPASKPPILTECKDGSVSMGGDCGKR